MLWIRSLAPDVLGKFNCLDTCTSLAILLNTLNNLTFVGAFFDDCDAFHHVFGAFPTFGTLSSKFLDLFW